MISVGKSDQRKRKKEQGQAAAFYSSVAPEQVNGIQSKGQLPTCVRYS